MPSDRLSLSPIPLWRRLRTGWSLLRNFAYDFRRFRKACFIDGPHERENLRAHIHILAHMLEYGMALSDPRAGFGMDKVRLLHAQTALYLDLYGADASTGTATAVLAAYAAFNEARGVDAAEAGRLLADLRRRAGDGALPDGGSETVAAADIRARAAIDFTAFMEARHSVRQYDPSRPVEIDRVERAVRAARQSPSSCNRQTVRALAFTERASIARILALHDGNRGFGDQLGGLMAVTVDLRHWNTVGERNQGWVDGGLFAMSLALGLHAEGFGTCMLNWSADCDRDRAMRALLRLDDTQIIITLIGFGHMRDRFAVPVSRRKPLDLVFSHEPPLAPQA